MRYEILDAEGAVENTVEAEADFMAAQYPEGNYRQAAEQIVPVVPPEDHRRRWVDVGPFKDRLGMDAPAIYASTHDACKGVVGLVEGRKYINLKDPRIAAMMQVLIATAQPAASAVWPGSGPMTAAKRDAILNTPTVEDERHIKGLV